LSTRRKLLEFVTTGRPGRPGRPTAPKARRMAGSACRSYGIEAIVYRSDVKLVRIRLPAFRAQPPLLGRRRYSPSVREQCPQRQKLRVLERAEGCARCIAKE
ncbi:hypothetical protein THAOC_26244, partial [Thalassiosira oceanica]